MEICHAPDGAVGKLHLLNVAELADEPVLHGDLVRGAADFEDHVVAAARQAHARCGDALAKAQGVGPGHAVLADGVLAIAGIEHIGVGIAVPAITARLVTGEERVIALAAFERARAGDGVVAQPAPEGVGAVGVDDGVVSFAPINGVVAIAAVDAVCAKAAFDYVVIKSTV